MRGVVPANDECAAAEPILVTGLDDCGTGAVTGTNEFSTETNDVPSCDISEFGIQDVWYSFNSGSESAIVVTLTPDANMTDHSFVVYEGCGGAEVACEILPDGTPLVVVVQPNTDYVVQVYSNLDFGGGGDFTLCVSADDSPAPVNDICSGGIPEALAIGNTVTFTGTTVGATLEGDYVQPEVFGVPAVWHAVTTTSCANLVLDFCGTTPAFTNGAPFISPTCPADTNTAVVFNTVDVTTCGDDNFTVTYLNVPAGTWYLPVWSEIGESYGEYTFNASAVACIDPPANDDCENAISITPTSFCSPVSGTTLGATESLQADLCSGSTGDADDDVWYSFEATGANMTVSVTGGTDFDAVLGVYAFGCGSFDLITCVDNSLGGEEETIDLTDLTIGGTYYYRIYDYFLGPGEDPTFTTCVTGELGTALTETSASGSWNVFPNPGNGLLNIAYQGQADRAVIDVLDLSGRLVHSEQLYLNNGQRAALNLNDRLANGAYTVRLTNSRGSTTQRVVVE